MYLVVRADIKGGCYGMEANTTVLSLLGLSWVQFNETHVITGVHSITSVAVPAFNPVRFRVVKIVNGSICPLAL